MLGSLGLACAPLLSGACAPTRLADLVVGLSPTGQRSLPPDPRLRVFVCVPESRSFASEPVLNCTIEASVRVGASAGVVPEAGFEVGASDLEVDSLEPLVVEVTWGDEVGQMVLDAPFGPRDLIGPTGPLELGSEVRFTWPHDDDGIGSESRPGKSEISGIETTIQRRGGGGTGTFPVRVVGRDIFVEVPAVVEAGLCPTLADCFFQLDVPYTVRVENCDLGSCAAEEFFRSYRFDLVEPGGGS